MAGLHAFQTSPTHPRFEEMAVDWAFVGAKKNHAIEHFGD